MLVSQVFAAAIGAAISAFIYERLSARGQTIYGIACAVFCLVVTVAAVAYGAAIF